MRKIKALVRYGYDLYYALKEMKKLDKTKIRFWDEKEKVMYPTGTINLFIDSTGDVFSYYNGELEVVKNMKLVHSTGLKDKNGKEIYEGDILTSNHYPFKDEGKYNYHGVIEWIEELASFYMTKRLANSEKRGISDGISEQIEDIEHFEVIGNIYENPELLDA
jgi:uncharacterized phage protein (TIGR01671 family)